MKTSSRPARAAAMAASVVAAAVFLTGFSPVGAEASSPAEAAIESRFSSVPAAEGLDIGSVEWQTDRSEPLLLAGASPSDSWADKQWAVAWTVSSGPFVSPFAQDDGMTVQIAPASMVVVVYNNSMSSVEGVGGGILYEALQPLQAGGFRSGLFLHNGALFSFEYHKTFDGADGSSPASINAPPNELSVYDPLSSCNLARAAVFAIDTGGSKFQAFMVVVSVGTMWEGGRHSGSLS